MIAAKPDRASAAIFTVGGTSYDIVTATGSFNTLQSQIEATPWWGDGRLAYNLAGTVGGSLGLFKNNVGPIRTSPFFIFSNTKPSYINSWAMADVDPDLYDEIALNHRFGDEIVTLAVLNPNSSTVPEPLTILGSITAAGFGVAFKRKKNSIRE